MFHALETVESVSFLQSLMQAQPVTMEHNLKTKEKEAAQKKIFRAVSFSMLYLISELLKTPGFKSPESVCAV